jgi:hypothetical protein
LSIGCSTPTGPSRISVKKDVWNRAKERSREGGERTNLEVIGGMLIVLLDGLGEDDERVSDVEMGDVVCQRFVNTYHQEYK